MQQSHGKKIAEVAVRRAVRPKCRRLWTRSKHQRDPADATKPMLDPNKPFGNACTVRKSSLPTPQCDVRFGRLWLSLMCVQQPTAGLCRIVMTLCQGLSRDFLKDVEPQPLTVHYLPYTLDTATQVLLQSVDDLHGALCKSMQDRSVPFSPLRVPGRSPQWP